MFTYYAKAILIIARHPLRVLRHAKAREILVGVARAEFRLHWLRDVARGYN